MTQEKSNSDGMLCLPTRPTFDLGPETFRTKSAARDRVRKLLNEWPLGQPLTDHDRAMVLAAVARHPDAARKIGPGVQSIVVREQPPYNSRGFWLIRTDGSDVDVSYRECFQPSTPAAKVHTALRMEVTDQISAFRLGALVPGVTCPGGISPCGRVLENTPDTHVDHHDPLFHELVSSFAQAFGGIRNLHTRSVERGIGDYLVNRAIAGMWRDFHGQHARLRLLCGSCNTSRPFRGGGIS